MVADIRLILIGWAMQKLDSIRLEIVTKIQRKTIERHTTGFMLEKTGDSYCLRNVRIEQLSMLKRLISDSGYDTSFGNSIMNMIDDAQETDTTWDC